MKRFMARPVLAFSIVFAGLLVAASFAHPRSASAISCSDFVFHRDADTVAQALPSDPYGLIDSSGETCGDSVSTSDDTYLTHDPTGWTLLNGKNHQSLPRGGTEMEVMTTPSSEIAIQLKQNIRFGTDHHFSVNMVDITMPVYGNTVRDNQCYGKEAKDHLQKSLPQGSHVWLVWNQIVNDGDVYGEIWLKDGDSYRLLNLDLVNDGYAVVAANIGYGRSGVDHYAADFAYAEQQAIANNKGLWKACSSASASGSSAPASSIQSPVADCTPFSSFQVAQTYYAGHRDEQPTIDPDNDGYACENYFGVDTSTFSGGPGSSQATDPRASDTGSGNGNGNGSFVGGESDSANGSDGGSTNTGTTDTGGQAAVPVPTDVPQVPTTDTTSGAPAPAGGDYNCSDFATQAQAQAAFDAAGGGPGYDPYGLDSDSDGVACELLP